MAGFDIQFRKDVFFAIKAPKELLLAFNLDFRDADFPFILGEQVMQKPIKEPVWSLIDLEFAVVGSSLTIHVEPADSSPVHKQKKGAVILNLVIIMLQG